MADHFSRSGELCSAFQQAADATPFASGGWTAGTTVLGEALASHLNLVNERSGQITEQQAAAALASLRYSGIARPVPVASQKPRIEHCAQRQSSIHSSTDARATQDQESSSRRTKRPLVYKRTIRVHLKSRRSKGSVLVMIVARPSSVKTGTQ